MNTMTAASGMRMLYAIATVWQASKAQPRIEDSIQGGEVESRRSEAVGDDGI